MKTNKKAISLIVLVITIIVLAILAATVIISLSNTNIIEQARRTAFKSDLASYKEAYALYLVDQKASDPYFDESSLNIDPTTNNTELYEKLFGDKYADKLKVENGKLVYVLDGDDEVIEQVVTEMGLAKFTLQIGDYVIYTPDPTNTTETYSIVEASSGGGFGNGGYYSPVDIFKQDDFKWIYIGNDGGNMLLVADTSSSDEAVVRSEQGGDYGNYQVVGADGLDTLCNELYKSDIATARSMNKNDTDRLLADTATQDLVSKINGANIPTYFLATEGSELQAENEEYDDIVFDYVYAVNLPGGYSVVDKYWTYGGTIYASDADNNYYDSPEECYDSVGETGGCVFYCGGEGEAGVLGHIRPVIVLNANVGVGEKTADGWTLEVK